jgi:protein-tyrosine kinase
MKGLKLGAGRSRRPEAARPPPFVRQAEWGAGWRSEGGYLFSSSLIPLAAKPGGGEVVGVLANNLVEQHIALGRRGLAICGASEGAGVTFVAANLAVALAMIGVSTLLVDTNLRRPVVQTLITPPEPRGGLYEVLEGRAPLDLNIAHQEILPQLSVVYAGQGQTSPSELLAGERFRDFASMCLRDYPCVIFDSPPANRSPDARAVGAAAGYALLVARQGRSYTDDLALLTQQLEQDHVVIVGAVLNGA